MFPFTFYTLKFRKIYISFRCLGLQKSYPKYLEVLFRKFVVNNRFVEMNSIHCKIKYKMPKGNGTE